MTGSDLRAFLTEHLERRFGPFDSDAAEALSQVVDQARWATLRAGDTLFHEGERSDSVYLLIAGRLMVVFESCDGEEVVGIVLPGETVGELALLTGEPRSKTVVGLRDSELVRLSASTFELLLEHGSQAVTTILANRLSGTRHDPARWVRAICALAVVPAGPDSRVGEVVDALERSLSKHGTVAVLTSASVDRALGADAISQTDESGPEHLRLLQWLHVQESRHRYLIYRGDPTWTPWTERCARQADRLTVVADAATTPALADLEPHLARPRRRWTLTLVHPATAVRPVNTSRWLADASAEGVVHMRSGHPDDLARLARILSGRAVGVVLSGGGARGFAHLGVLRAMDELGIPVDILGGASIGAAMAHAGAQGFDAAAAQTIVHRGFRRLLDFTLPIASVLAGHRITAVIDKHCGDWDIEDSWVPFFCVSTNLTRGCTQVHRRGNMAHAIRASVAIPGVLPPVTDNGELLVDGGVLNNLPLDVMRELNPSGTVIAVDVVEPTGPEAHPQQKPGMSGWALALQRLNPFRSSRPVPSIAGAIVNSMVAGAARARRAALESRLADLYLNIRVPGVSLLEFDKVEEVAELGYAESLGPLSEWIEAGGLANV